MTSAVDGVSSDGYTTSEELINFISSTGGDALALAICIAHGAYKSKSCFDIEKFKSIRVKVDTSSVLHSGAGSFDDGFGKIIKTGIVKVKYVCMVLRGSWSVSLSYLPCGDGK